MPDAKMQNIGNIKEFTLHIPDDMPGGVIVFKGANGAGKTTAIDVINALVSGKGSLAVRDRAAKGSAELGEAKISVAKTTRRSGESEYATLEGRFDLLDLVSPKEQQPEARFKKRLKALVGLAGVKGDPKLFYDLVGGQAALEAMVTPEQLKTDDLVELSGRVKRGIDAAARKAESDQEHAEKHAAAATEAAAGIDVTKPDDAAALQQTLIAASNRKTALDTQATAYRTAKQKATEAQAQLDEFTKTAPDVKAAESEYDTALAAVGDRTKDVAEADKQVAELERQLAAAQAKLKTAQTAKTTAEQSANDKLASLSAARKAHEAADGWRSQIKEVETLPCPTEDELAQASRAEAEAKAAQEYGVQVRSAKEQLAKAEKYRAEASLAQAYAEKLRAAAKKVDDVLTEQIPQGPLRIEAGEFVLDTARGEGVPYDQCSDGERYGVAIPYAVRAVGEGGIICLPQEGWQHLDDGNRMLVAGSARDASVWIVTGEVAEGALRQEVISPAPTAA
jgi:ABC-type cobalamin/Fe3+-siderophores transport system ATPase subunit